MSLLSNSLRKVWPKLSRVDPFFNKPTASSNNRLVHVRPDRKTTDHVDLRSGLTFGLQLDRNSVGLLEIEASEAKIL